MNFAVKWSPEEGGVQSIQRHKDCSGWWRQWQPWSHQPGRAPWQGPPPTRAAAAGRRTEARRRLSRRPPGKARGDGGDGTRAAHRQEHVGVAGTVARPGGEVVGDRAVVDSAGTHFHF
jgi:hypothetical protein